MRLTAQQVMVQPAEAIQPADSVAAAVRAMQARGVSSLIVLPRFEGDPFGIVTKGDVVARVVAAGRDPQRVRVAEVMTWPVVMARPESSLGECVALMRAHHVRRLPVCGDDGPPVGILCDTDVYAALLQLMLQAGGPHAR
jgi:isocitrate dehydrogenase